MNSPPLLKHSTDRQTGKPTDRQGDRLRQDYTDNGGLHCRQSRLFFLLFSSFFPLLHFSLSLLSQHSRISRVLFLSVIRFTFLLVFPLSRVHTHTRTYTLFSFFLFLLLTSSLSLSFNTCSQTRANNHANMLTPTHTHT